MVNIYPKFIIILMIFLVSILINFNIDTEPNPKPKVKESYEKIIKKDTIRIKPLPGHIRFFRSRFLHRNPPVC